MDILNNLALGLGVAFSLQNLASCLAGVALGTLFGVLLGVHPLVTSMALCFIVTPNTISLPLVPSLLLLVGLYLGAHWGSSTASILVNLPGETDSGGIARLDGHQMARQGRAGPALTIAALASFFAGCVGPLLIALLAPPLASLKLGPAEHFSLMLTALTAAAVLSRGDPFKGLAVVVLGLLLGLVGTDVNSGVARYTFAVRELADGIGFGVVLLGLLGLAEVTRRLERNDSHWVLSGKLPNMMPTRKDLKAAFWAALRGTGLGAFFGLLPNTGPALAVSATSVLERRFAREPAQLGQGATEGVAAPQAANIAATQTSFIPTLALGFPGTPVLGLMIAAMMIQGVAPGPQVIPQRPSLFWGIVASMWICNLLLLVLNLPLARIWVRLLSVPYRWLFPSIIFLFCIVVFVAEDSPADLLLLSLAGLLGYVLLKLECQPALLVLGYWLGPGMEENLRRTTQLALGDPTVFFTHPICVALMLATLFILFIRIAPALGKKRGAV